MTNCNKSSFLFGLDPLFFFYIYIWSSGGQQMENRRVSFGKKLDSDRKINKRWEREVTKWKKDNLITRRGSQDRWKEKCDRKGKIRDAVQWTKADRPGHILTTSAAFSHLNFFSALHRTFQLFCRLRLFLLDPSVWYITPQVTSVYCATLSESWGKTCPQKNSPIRLSRSFVTQNSLVDPNPIFACVC